MEKTEKILTTTLSTGSLLLTGCATFFIALWVLVFNVVVPSIIAVWWYRNTNTPKEDSGDASTNVPINAPTQIQEDDFANW